MEYLLGYCFNTIASLVPRPLLDFISQLWKKLLRDKIWERPGDEANYNNSQDPDPGKGQLGGSFWYLGSFLQEPFKFADGILKVSVLGTRTLGGDHQLSSLVNA